MAVQQEITPTVRATRALLNEAGRLHAAAGTLLEDRAVARDDVRRAVTALRGRAAYAELGSVPVSRLRDVTNGRLRLGALEKAGYTNVRQVIDAGVYDLQLIPGIGPQTAAQLHGAARQLAEAAEETVSVRLDIEDRDAETSALVVALHRLVTAGPDLPQACGAARAIHEALAPLLAPARPAGSRIRMMFAGAEGRDEARRAVGDIGRIMADETSKQTELLIAQATVDLLRPAVSETEAWIDFELRSAEYYSLLAEIAALPADHHAAEGFLPDELSGRVKAQPLDDAHLRVSLRGYQSFGARFALAQGRVIIGDEMGLGKTVQAIAAMAHLKSRGETHFLVACPASVLINWTREIEQHSRLRAYRLHGAERDTALGAWLSNGDVGVTTIDSLYRLDIPTDVRVGMFLVDEAHFAKNPDTRRSQAIARWCARTARVLFLTGTPMENRVEEFRNLVEYLQPQLVPSIEPGAVGVGAQAFRRSVAPAYLRRNQQDVLTELPEVIYKDEWEEFSPQDEIAYRAAVESRNFMAMRRAAYGVPATSAKLERLCELVEEAHEGGHKVVIFSNFRDVLTTVEGALAADGVFGPITGSISAVRRQELVDEFTAASGHAVLLSQIQAGGVGLNMQAASVVIICEPQVKPTMETQAIARAHRMGQVRTVYVHRLLTPDSVDQRMVQILATKQALFDAYARRSDLAEAASEAVDISEPSLARQIIEAEQQRLADAGAGVRAGGRADAG